MDNCIELTKVTKKYRDFCLGPINIAVKKGYITAVIGRNGAGKTTLLKGISGLEPITSGKMCINGINPIEDVLVLKQQIAYVCEKVNLYSDFTCAEVIQFVSSFYPTWDKQLESTLVDQLQIPLKKKLYELSKGMKVKLNILLALAFHPKVLLLDEPTEGLDSIVRKQFIDLLLDFIQDEEKTVLISTHITTDIEEIADYLIFLKDGQIVLHGEKEFFQDDLCFIHAPTSDKIDKSLFLGYKESNMSIQGIVRKIDSHAFLGATIEIPKIDQLLFFVVEGGK